MMIRRVALVVVSSLLALDVLALGDGCSGDDGQGGNTPLLGCDDGGCAGQGANAGASSSSGGGGTSTGAGTGSDDGAGDDGGGSGSTGSGISDGGGSGNILPTDTGSTGSLPTNTE